MDWRPIHLQVGESLKLTCWTTEEGFKYRWTTEQGLNYRFYKDGVLMTSQENNGILIVDSMNITDTGNYTCTVYNGKWNSMSDVSNDVSVTVSCKYIC